MKTFSGDEHKEVWPYPTLFAHRGGGIHAPENTLAAIKTGHAHSYAAVEFDVKLSGDSVAILMHDSTLERTTNGRGRVADMVASELESLDAGAWHSEAFRGERVPRFSAVAKYLHGLGLMANVEIKPCEGREAETGKMVAELCVEFWQDRFVKPLVSSFSVDALKAARAVAPQLPMGLLVKIPCAEHLPLLESLGCVSLHCHHEHITADLVRLFHGHGYRVMTYTVNEPGRVIELLALGVDGIFTDQLELMAKKFAHQLNDAGKPVSDPVELDIDWQSVVPPMP
ncbi:MAG: glycerophosphodiester phosphodiesterase [Betaproteobacteria bacterium]|nr:glycerophosphodiester phosphodiesterase [Betaproteobacteria bacterium]